MESKQRLPTGIPELDAIMGGYPIGRSFLISGEAGTGKTILALHFTLEAVKMGKKVVFLATEETPEDLKRQASGFGWDLEPAEKEGLLEIRRVLDSRVAEAKYEYAGHSSAQELGKLINLVPPGTDNLVIDNMGVYALGMDIKKFREQIDFFTYELGSRGITTLMICDNAIGEAHRDVATYSVFGAIWLSKRNNPYTDVRERVMEIVKVRDHSVPIDYIMFDIADDGIQIQSRGERTS